MSADIPISLSRFLGGWLDLPDHVEAYNAALPPRLAAAAPDDGSDRLFWEHEKQVLGRLLPPHQQRSQDCVPHSWGRAVDDLFLRSISSLSSWTGETATEPLYGGGRIQIAHGLLPSGQPIRGEGSCGPWTAEWLSRYGRAPRAYYGQYDLRLYSITTTLFFGHIPGPGVPEVVQEAAKKQPLLAAQPVHSFEQAWADLGQWQPVVAAASRGFYLSRDDLGFCGLSSARWDHSWCLRGRMTVKGRGKALAVQNSMGDYLGGSKDVVLESGRTVTLPPGCFLITPEDATVLLAQEAYALPGLAPPPA